MKNSVNVGHGLLHLTANDPDADDNGALHYTVKNAFLYTVGSSVTSGAVKPSPFNVTQSGKLVTSHLMAEYVRDWFELQVTAGEKASPYREAAATVQVRFHDAI